MFNLQIKRIRRESAYKKFLNLDVINLLINKFKVDVQRIEYMSSIKNPIKIVLEFYKQYDYDYYEIIEEGILNGKIVIIEEGKSFVDTMDGIAKIKPINEYPFKIKLSELPKKSKKYDISCFNLDEYRENRINELTDLE